MTISNNQINCLLDENRGYVSRIIRYSYPCADAQLKEELEQVGMIGLWHGIQAYAKYTINSIDKERFVSTICAYIRYEIKKYFRNSNLIKIGPNQWRNFTAIKKYLQDHPDASEGNLQELALRKQYNLSSYRKTENLLHIESLDASIAAEANISYYFFYSFNDPKLQTLLDRDYILYIVNSALAAIDSNRDQDLICEWLNSIYYCDDMSRAKLARRFGLSCSMVNVIIHKFIELCRFVRDSDLRFSFDANGYIYFPQKSNRNMYNGQKIPGVKWAQRNHKWKVEITLGKNKSIFIGYYARFDKAVLARRNAEIQYRGKSNISLKNIN